MVHVVARQDGIVGKTHSHGRRRWLPSAARPARAAIRPRRRPPRRPPSTWPAAVAPVPDDLLLALMA